jgi:hypothetical protein
VGDGEEFYSHSDLVKDVYFGRDRNNPSITTRLDRLETFRQTTEMWQTDLRGWFKALILFSLGQTCAIIGGLIWLVVKGK